MGETIQKGFGDGRAMSSLAVFGAYRLPGLTLAVIAGRCKHVDGYYTSCTDFSGVGFFNAKVVPRVRDGPPVQEKRDKEKTTTVAWVRRGFVCKVNSSLRKVSVLAPLNGLECGGGGTTFVRQL